MWLYRGAQSAVFYYAACTPCVAGLDRKKRKRQATRAMRQKEKEREKNVISSQPTVFHQPSPFSTNVYWNEEITLGPGPPAKRGGIRNGSRSGSRRNVGSSMPGSPPTLSSQSTREVDELSSHTTETAEGSKKPLGGDRWNWIRYQREDEVLWGREVKGSSIGLSGRGRADTAGSKKYYVATNPAVNDLHPPVVSGPSSRADTRWMLQPPPSAKIMAGKVRCGAASPSREDSVNRRGLREVMYGVPLEEDESEDEGRGSLGQRSGRNQSLHGLNRPPSHSPVSSKSQRKRSRIPSPITISKDHHTTAESSADSKDLRLPTRPALATIASSSTIPALHKQSNQIPRASSSINSLSNSPSPLSTPGDTSHTTPTPWQWQFNWPEESPDFRPTSRATDDSGKAFHIPVSTSLWATNAKHRDPHDVYLDADGDDLDSEHMRGIRPYRWSMDI